MRREATHSGHEESPGIQSLTRPDPEARGYPHRQTHEVFQHEDREVWKGLFTAGQTIRTTITLLPLFEGEQFVESACNDGPCRHDVENTEDSNLHHQLLQLVNLSSASLLLDHISYLEQTDEASTEE